MPAVRKHWGTILGVGIGLAALAWAARGLPLAETWAVVLNAHYGYILPAIVAYLASYTARAIRWRVLLRAGVPLGEALHAMNAGFLLNNLLPLRLGELARAYLVGRSRAPSLETLSTIVAERFLDLLSAVTVLAITLPLVASSEWMRRAGWTAAAVAVGGLVGLLIAAHQRQRLVSLARRLVQRLPRFEAPLTRLLVQADFFLGGLQPLRDGRLFARVIFWSAVVWTLSGLVNWLVLRIFLPAPPLVLGYYSLGAAAIANAVPSSPGQAGVREAAIVTALRQVGVPQSAAFSYALLIRVVGYIYSGLFGSLALSHYGETLSSLARAAQTLLGRRKAAIPEAAAEL